MRLFRVRGRQRDRHLRSERRRPPDVTQHLAGFIRATAATIEAAKSLLAPASRTSKTGGTVEIGELPRM